MSDDAEASPPAAAARPAWRRVGGAMLAACLVASVVMTVWAYLVAPHVPDAVQDVLGVVILFALAPVTAYVLLRGSRWWVRLALGVAMLVLAWKSLRSRPPAGTTPEPPAWTLRLESMHAGAAVALG